MNVISISPGEPSFSLPMRDGNLGLLKDSEANAGFSLPMRDGNRGPGHDNNLEVVWF